MATKAEVKTMKAFLNRHVKAYKNQYSADLKYHVINYVDGIHMNTILDILDILKVEPSVSRLNEKYYQVSFMYDGVQIYSLHSSNELDARGIKYERDKNE